ncbi:hypothetical protein [Hymenobacter jeollabukensis]|uniref:Uncharacterized protein n=1 Tax=Hymenobacter jeollabukensis TaxID=2025313 RepID=A0A5R8WWU5_9BACT|nr:hypothetical protein [Hymenobacter jeollabukensis]TLM96625.1 hypothetical protein FDY95_01115 [Hymenobacter jeollabukensis]
MAVLSYDKTDEYFYRDSRKELFGGATNLELTPRELVLTDSLLQQSVAAWNRYQRQHGYTGPLLNSKGYKRQLIAVIDTAGEKRVWINGFCGADGSGWKKRIIQVWDGGICYFNVKLNLSRKTWEELDVNNE